MTRQDYEFAKSIYDRMFYMQVFKPEDMREAFRRLFGSEPANVQQARGRVAAYFRYNVQPVFEDETISVSNEGQSHQEDLGDIPIPSLDEIGKANKPKRTRVNKKSNGSK